MITSYEGAFSKPINNENFNTESEFIISYYFNEKEGIAQVLLNLCTNNFSTSRVNLNLRPDSIW